MVVQFVAPTADDYVALFGVPIHAEVLRINGMPHAMAMLARKPDGRVFAWTSFRHDFGLDKDRDAQVGRLVVLAMRRALRDYRRKHPSEPIYSGADERGYPQVRKMLKALRFVETDERQRENLNRVWVWLP